MMDAAVVTETRTVRSAGGDGGIIEVGVLVLGIEVGAIDGALERVGIIVGSNVVGAFVASVGAGVLSNTCRNETKVMLVRL